MKKAISTILGFIAAIAMILATGEAENPMMQIPWTLMCMAVVAVCAKVMDKMGVFDEEEA